MKVEHVGADTGELADPAAAVWGGLSGESVPLAAVPLEAQPTQYIRTAWADREYGRTPEARVAAAQDGQRLYVRIEWAADDAANGEFQDPAGVLFPIADAGSPPTLGAPAAPAWPCAWDHRRRRPVHPPAPRPGVVRTGPGPGRISVDATGASRVPETGRMRPRCSIRPVRASRPDASRGRIQPLMRLLGSLLVVVKSLQ